MRQRPVKSGGVSKGETVVSPFGIRLYKTVPLPCQKATLFCTVSAWEGAGGGNHKASPQAGETRGWALQIPPMPQARMGGYRPDWVNRFIKSRRAKPRGIFTASPATDPRAGTRRQARRSHRFSDDGGGALKRGLSKGGRQAPLWNELIEYNPPPAPARLKISPRYGRGRG